MTENQQRDRDIPSTDDHETDPAIGQSKGIGGREDLELIEGENTVEGDVENDSTFGGGVDPAQLGRTNR
jgi:hypothetical protein